MFDPLVVIERTLLSVKTAFSSHYETFSTERKYFVYLIWVFYQNINHSQVNI
jgi:hypothetical protein